MQHINHLKKARIMTIRRKRALSGQPSHADSGTIPTPIGLGCSRVFVNTETGEQFDIDEHPEYGGIPVRIDRLIDNKAYRRKFAAMIRQGQLPYLLALADKADSNAVFRSNYFVSCCSKERWQNTRSWIIAQGTHAKYQPLEGTPQTIERIPTSISGGWSYAGPGDERFIPNISLHVHAQRFWSKTDHATAWHRFAVFGYPDDCINWTGKPDKDGYGRFSADGRTYAAHRFSYELHSGPLPPKIEVDHRCRNKMCINPAHLEAVSGKVNLSRRKFNSPLPEPRKLSDGEQRRIARERKIARIQNEARQRSHEQDERRKRERQWEADRAAEIRGELDGVITQIVDLVAAHHPDQERERITRIVEGTVQREDGYSKVLSPEKQIERAREMLAYNQDKYQEEN